MMRYHLTKNGVLEPIKPSVKKRIVGIDVARALAVIGMIVVNFKIVIGENGLNWVKSFAGIFDGKAAATFVVLAGLGLALMTNSAIKNNNKLTLELGPGSQIQDPATQIDFLKDFQFKKMIF